MNEMGMAPNYNFCLIGLLIFLVPMIISLFLFFKGLKDKEHKTALNIMSFIFLVSLVDVFFTLYVMFDNEDTVRYDHSLNLTLVPIAFILFDILFLAAILMVVRKGKVRHIDRDFSILLAVSIYLMIGFPMISDLLPGERETNVFSIDLEIDTPEGNQYVLYIPTFYSKDPILSYLKEETSQGSFTISQIWDQGDFLRIEANGPISLNYDLETTDEVIWTAEDLRSNDVEESLRLYYHPSSDLPLNLTISYSLFGFSGDYSIEVEGTLGTDGWQSVPGKYYEIEV